MRVVWIAAAALVAAGAAWASEGEEGIVSISPKLVLFQVLNFGILVVAVVFLFRWQMVPRLRAREERIRKAIDDAERSRVEMERLKGEHAKLVEDVRSRAKDILDNAAKQAASDREEILHRAKVEANAAVERATSEIEQERQRVTNELRAQVADLTVAATKRLIAKEMDADTQRKQVDEFLASLDKQAAGR